MAGGVYTLLTVTQTGASNGLFDVNIGSVYGGAVLDYRGLYGAIVA